MYGRIQSLDVEGNWRVEEFCRPHPISEGKMKTLHLSNKGASGFTFVFHNEDEILDLIKLLGRNMHKVVD